MSTQWTPVEQAQHLRDLCTALRSGEFKQGEKALHPTEDTYCCLGVGCELFRRSTGLGEWGRDDSGDLEFVLSKTADDDGDFYGEFDSADWTRLGTVRDYYGMPTSGDYTLVNLFFELPKLNDGNEEEGISPKDFPRIADYIEQTLIPLVEAKADA